MLVNSCMDMSLITITFTIHAKAKHSHNIYFCMQTGVTALYVACKHGHDDIVALLLNAGADINKVQF